MGDRTMQIRFLPGASGSQRSDEWATTVGAALVPVWHESVTVLGYRFQQQGVSFSLPVSGAIAYPVGTNTDSFFDYEHPSFVSIVGRGALSGKRCRSTIFGIPFTGDANYRLSPGEQPLIDALRSAYVGLRTLGGWRTVAGDEASVYNYANTGYNSYYQRQARK
jgi:hypothetical protein